MLFALGDRGWFLVTGASFWPAIASSSSSYGKNRATAHYSPPLGITPQRWHNKCKLIGTQDERLLRVVPIEISVALKKCAANHGRIRTVLM